MSHLRRATLRRGDEQPVIYVLKYGALPGLSREHFNRETQLGKDLRDRTETERTSTVLKPTSTDLEGKKMTEVLMYRQMVKSVLKIDASCPRILRHRATYDLSGVHREFVYDKKLIE